MSYEYVPFKRTRISSDTFGTFMEINKLEDLGQRGVRYDDFTIPQTGVMYPNIKCYVTIFAGNTGIGLTVTLNLVNKLTGSVIQLYTHAFPNVLIGVTQFHTGSITWFDFGTPLIKQAFDTEKIQEQHEYQLVFERTDGNPWVGQAQCVIAMNLF